MKGFDTSAPVPTSVRVDKITVPGVMPGPEMTVPTGMTSLPKAVGHVVAPWPEPQINASVPVLVDGMAAMVHARLGIVAGAALTHW